MKSGTFALKLARWAHAKLGEDILIIDLRGMPVLADFFVLVTAGSSLHAQAVARELEEKSDQSHIRLHHSEGMENGQWIVLDYFDVVVHILLADVRRFYGLERLWGDVPIRVYPKRASSD